MHVRARAAASPGRCGCSARVARTLHSNLAISRRQWSLLERCPENSSRHALLDLRPSACSANMGAPKELPALLEMRVIRTLEE